MQWCVFIRTDLSVFGNSQRSYEHRSKTTVPKQTSRNSQHVEHSDNWRNKIPNEDIGFPEFELLERGKCWNNSEASSVAGRLYSYVGYQGNHVHTEGRYRLMVGTTIWA